MGDELFLLAAPGASEADVKEVREAIEFAGEYADLEAHVVVFGGELESISKDDLRDIIEDFEL